MKFIGPYYVDADATGTAYYPPDYIDEVTIGAVCDGKAAPYRVDHNGVAIGWAKRSAFKKMLPGNPKVGDVATVKHS